MKTPVSLLQRLKQSSDGEAWSRFVELYLPFVCYWARRAGLQDADVADLSQEVFTLLYRKMPEFRYDEHKSFRAWLRAVTLNKWRELRRRGGLPVGTMAGNGATLESIAVADPGHALWDEEHQRYLATRALDLMRKDFEPATWQACWDTAVENCAASEVAARLGLTVGAVYAAKCRVLRRLRLELEGLL
jgi:RNA polymerase sigma-70 factor (ECF subfamily)